MENKRLGIVVGGGPAPGINAVIGAATIEAAKRGFEVIGFYEGFRWLASDEFHRNSHAVVLEIAQVARIHFDGGSILRTSRTNLLDDARRKQHRLVAPDAHKIGEVIRNLRALGITHLLTIGGDDTALSARFICDSAEDDLRVVHVPKTIDNDLPLPQEASTFGFPTARFVGTQLVKNLMRDSQTTGRWYICQTMGRGAGWLALSIGMAAGTTLTLIPEEFEDNIKLHHIVDVVEGAILKRRVMGRTDGVAILAEGLAYRLGDVAELERLLGHTVPTDAAGHPRLAEVDLARLVKNEVERRFRERGQKITLVDHELGYELRCADPTPRDMLYCRSLGYFAVQLLMQDTVAPGVLVTIVNGNLNPIDLHDLIDPKTNRIAVRTVNIRSDMYRVARAFMIRLERSDLEDPAALGKLAAEANMAPKEFAKRYGRAATRLVDGLPVTD
ncbi:MAG: 6-phosphofructokinase [Phycisphaerae bacterium]